MEALNTYIMILLKLFHKIQYQQNSLHLDGILRLIKNLDICLLESANQVVFSENYN